MKGIMPQCYRARDTIKKNLIQFAGLTACIFIIGCATSYQPNGFTGGYTDTQLAPDVFRVTFRGNGHTAPERVQDFAMLHAAELALQNGFAHIAILGENNSTTTHSFTTQGQAYTTGSAYVYGNYATYSGNTTYTPGQTFTFYKPSTALTFQCFKLKPEGVLSFDAAFLLNSIRQKYGVTIESQRSEKGPHGTVAYLVEVESSEPGAKVEVNNEYVGKTPLVLKVFGDKDGTFHKFAGSRYSITAYPVIPGQHPQTKDFKTVGWFITKEDKIPKKIFFEFDQVQK
jgi:hypothetical protein